MTSHQEAGQAQALFAEIDEQPTILNIARTLQRLQPRQTDLTRLTLKVACVGSFTFDPLLPALQLQGIRAGIAIEPYVSPFGQFEQALIDPTSGLASFEPDVVLLALRLQDVCPALHEGFNSLARENVDRLVEDWLGRLESGLRSFRSRSAARVLVQNYDLPAVSADGVLDPAFASSQSAAIVKANRALVRLAASIENTHVMNYDALVARHGRRNWIDPRTAFYARVPVAAEHYWRVGGFYVQHIRPLLGLSRKVLVLDADNTLWGGVVGDVGLNHIDLGHDFPGYELIAIPERLVPVKVRRRPGVH